ncbi:hypothetical protein [Gemmatimonas groenlandica]|uniref:Uncharacterized protein n=1 Tax=Gemmatimonas groenlandica TaxID=2732249 RepID=A0A6M4II63_9BACT|nr:hypothetical protein [Gemmatimonas groenlandica]QJR34310.1 hypothetical protein HKW67_01620 [Gemmatimonas groenlandica]
MTWSARPPAPVATAYPGARAPGVASPVAAGVRGAGALPERETARTRALTKGAAKSEKDSQIVTSLVVAFVLVVLAVGSLRVRGNMRVTQSKDAVSGTLKAVHERQSTFRLLNQRFATWRELEARGMRLPTEQAVVKSNATASHWFVSVRDSATGVICDKTGELFDESPDERRPVCREPGK